MPWKILLEWNFYWIKIHRHEWSLGFRNEFISIALLANYHLHFRWPRHAQDGGIVEHPKATKETTTKIGMVWYILLEEVELGKREGVQYHEWTFKQAYINHHHLQALTFPLIGKKICSLIFFSISLSLSPVPLCVLYLPWFFLSMLFSFTGPLAIRKYLCICKRNL